LNGVLFVENLYGISVFAEDIDSGRWVLVMGLFVEGGYEGGGLYEGGNGALLAMYLSHIKCDVEFKIKYFS
jgi:hypothetical protein